MNDGSALTLHTGRHDVAHIFGSKNTMAIAMTSAGISHFLFGMHSGHLNNVAEEIAKANGCVLIRHTDPTGDRRGWFATPDRGEARNSVVRDKVLSAINVLGGCEALRLPYSDEFSASQLALIGRHHNWYVTCDFAGVLKRKDPRSTTATDWVPLTPAEIAAALDAAVGKVKKRDYSTTDMTDDEIHKEIEYLLAVKSELEAIRAARAAGELEDAETAAATIYPGARKLS